ncbi:hypothetical protein C9374_010738 [Naegleria lovaniensis]|uniref:Alkyl hydroperoxide reductase subunit C/ Thiol specific antioxidant domain-containing protein n=1 Tax=Naegleria lovaniensis TaxID=51637 RepID=A0AA88GFN5_NAELO|nr:uncharacterized protein C9374_010738 [Naegleria lovaniensis]KAG2374454.1 hypothetical protein C9374_010738 [Naegleria lovaniensis]
MPSNHSSLFWDKCSMYFTLKNLFKLPTAVSNQTTAAIDGQHDTMSSPHNHHLESSTSNSNNRKSRTLQDFTFPKTLQEQEQQQNVTTPEKRKSWFKRKSPSSPSVSSASNVHTPPSGSSSSTHSKSLIHTRQNPNFNNSSSPLRRTEPATEIENKRRSIFGKLLWNNGSSSSNSTSTSSTRRSVSSPESLNISVNSVTSSNSRTSKSSQLTMSPSVKKNKKAKFLILIFIRGSWCEECVNYLQQLDKIVYEKVTQEFGGNIAAVVSQTSQQASDLKKQLNLRFEVVSDERMILAEKYGMNCILKGSIVYKKMEAMYKTRYMTKTGGNISDYMLEIIDFIDKHQKSDVKKSNTSENRPSMMGLNSTEKNATVASDLNDVTLVISDDDEEDSRSNSNGRRGSHRHRKPTTPTRNIAIDEQIVVDFFESKWQELFNVDNKFNTGFTQPGALILNRKKKEIYSWKDGYSLTQQQEHIQQLIMQQELLKQQEEEKKKEIDNFLLEWDFNQWLTENPLNVAALVGNNDLSASLSHSHGNHLSDDIKKAYRKTISIARNSSKRSSQHMKHLQKVSDSFAGTLSAKTSPSKSPPPIKSPLSPQMGQHWNRDSMSSTNDDNYITASFAPGSIFDNINIAQASKQLFTEEGNETTMQSKPPTTSQSSRLSKRRPSSDPLKSLVKEELDKQEKQYNMKQIRKNVGHLSINFSSTSGKSNLLIDRSFVEERIPPKHLLTIAEYYASLDSNQN